MEVHASRYMFRHDCHSHSHKQLRGVTWNDKPMHQICIQRSVQVPMQEDVHLQYPALRTCATLVQQQQAQQCPLRRLVARKAQGKCFLICKHA